MNSRRDFLQKLTASLIILNLPGQVSAYAATSGLNTQTYDGPPLRVAIMGLGSYGSRVAEAMQACKKAKIVGVISGTPSKISTWQSKYNIPAKNCYNYENFDDIKNNPDIDAVYVITPNALHRDQVIRVAKAGKHVICEKPMGLNAKECEEMIDACKKANVKLLVGYRMHFEPNTVEIINQRSRGEFGRILSFEGGTGFPIGDPTQWRLNKALAGGGSLMDVGIYAVNGARYMVGQEPVWVTAQETKTNPAKFKEGVDETIQFQLGFPNGAIASCVTSYNISLDRFVLNGDKGFAELRPAFGYGPIKARTNKGELSFPHVMHQTTQMDEMAGIILGNNKPVFPVDGEEGLKDLKVIDAIYLAVKTGKKVPLSL
ncbi:glucose-fructose oxidoreductase [Cellvibrio zantedeschiae]|uniref:Glucose-fructose oxidoreductase n=1 Tax=Cellvibrio zantedeschiae TaxID=1237077 RepID=A0ABQ3B240_9GAMM|nr:Gfo/Idh/MocA family oxidoreductase [Cellvibrio zantedeschiae]GGY71269.1 glucose-fructose oxidoreductase [Cellvibrio zantedeschiae]